MRLTRFSLPAALSACALYALAAKYTGPVPPKPDLPYLVHADNLVETERAQASEDKRRDETTFRVAGASSPARTPLAEPIFLMQSEKIAPENLELYRLEVKGGNREIVFKKKGPRAYRLTVTPLGDRLYRIEVDEGLGLENGEYSLTPSGSNDVFCFEVY